MTREPDPCYPSRFEPSPADSPFDEKCLEKEPRRRYPSAAALAEDPRHFLVGKPVLARPASAIARGQRWCRRNLMVASLAAGLFGVLFTGLAATAAHWARAERNAVKQTELRMKVEALTRELLQLAEEIRSLETARPPKSVEASARKSADFPMPADARLGEATALACASVPMGDGGRPCTRDQGPRLWRDLSDSPAIETC